MLTLQDLRELCDRYVPLKSRHDRSFDGPDWWPAHEIGHLLVASPREIGVPLFGVGDGESVIDFDEILPLRRAYLLTIECAAMTVSRRLLTAAGMAAHAQSEAEDTDQGTMNWWFDHQSVVQAFLRQRCPRVPRTRSRLENLCARRVGRTA